MSFRSANWSARSSVVEQRPYGEIPALQESVIVRVLNIVDHVGFFIPHEKICLYYFLT